MRVAASLLCLTCLGQDIAIRPVLSAGDVFQLELVRLREDSRRPQGNGTSRTPVTVRVLEKAETGWVVSWRYGTTQFDNPAVANNPVLASASRFVKDLDFEVILDADGAYKGLRNSAKVTKQLEAMLDALLKTMGGGQPAEMVKQVLSPAVMLNSSTQEVQIYFGLNGAELPPKAAVRTAIQQPNPLGGEPIGATFRVWVVKADAGIAELASRTDYDPDTLSRIVSGLAQRLGLPSGLAKAKLGEAEILDYARYHYDRARGLMRQVVLTRRISVPNVVSKVDQWDIRLVR